MAELFRDPGNVPLEAQLKCVEREIRMRERVYPRQVAAGSMKQGEADRELHVMRAVLETLQQVAKKGL